MKISILNGSPKGDQSVTMQYILYLEKKIPEHEYTILNVAQTIHMLEKNEEKFEEVLDQLKDSDLIVWGFPVYVMLIPSQYKRFIELLFERRGKEYLKEKYTAVLSTSIHFYDNTAQNYMHAICDDFKMKFIDFYAADSWDLLIPKERARWLKFGHYLLERAEKKVPTTRQYPTVQNRDFNYEPSGVTEGEKISLTQDKNLLLLCDNEDKDSNIGKMIQRFQESFKDEITTIYIDEIDIKGGCIGCCKCGYEHICFYKDEFMDFWNNKLRKADIIVFAGELKDRFLSAKWKRIMDRAFFNNHTPTLMKKQIGYLISGPLSQNPNTKEILQAYFEFQNSNVVDFVTDEYGNSTFIDRLITNLAKSLFSLSEKEIIKPETFRGFGGMKVFRDDVYGRNRFVFLADHEKYEELGIYDSFPQRDERAKKMNEKFIPLLRIEKVRQRMDLKKEFLRPFEKVIQDPDK